MTRLKFKRGMALFLSMLITFIGVQSAIVQATVVSTDQMISVEKRELNRNDLIKQLQQDEVKDRLVEMGVDPKEVEQRVASLTDEELQQINDRIDEMPAGSGVLGLLVTIFIVLVITDMLCATNVFSFVRCINK